MKVNFDIQLNKSQLDMMNLVSDDNIKFILAALSRQQGKSVLCKVLCTQWLLEKNREIGYITPTLKLAKKFFNDLTSVLPQCLLVKSNASDLVLQSITGSTLYFYSAEQGNRIRGNTFDYLVLDEAAFFKEGDGNNHIWYSVLSPTVKVKGKKVIMVSTPNGCQGFWYELIQLAEQGQKGYSYIKRTIYDDSMCEDIDEIRNTTPDIMFRQEYLCEFLEDANSFFSGYHNCYVESQQINWKDQLWCGIDWSSTGKDETVMTFIDTSGGTFQMVCKGSFDERYQRLSTMINKYPNIVGIYSESNSIGSVMNADLKKLLKRKHIFNEFLTTNESKTEIITELAIDLEQGALSYNDKELDKQLGAFGFSVSKSKKLTFEGINGVHDDRVMSLALACEAKRKLRSKSGNIVFA